MKQLLISKVAKRNRWGRIYNLSLRSPVNEWARGPCSLPSQLFELYKTGIKWTKRDSKAIL